MMPARLELTLIHPDSKEQYPARLYSAARAIFGAEPDVRGPLFEAFAVAPLTAGAPGRFHWELGWICSAPPPSMPGSVRFGHVECRVLDVRVVERSFADLAAGPPVGSVELDVISPLYFSREGRDHPLPDPVLIVQSLLRRWNAFAPPELTIDRVTAKALLGSVRVTGMAGATPRTNLTLTTEQIGFVGQVRLAVEPGVDAAVTRALRTLAEFAPISGIGAQTTHGFGACRMRSAWAGREPARRLAARGGAHEWRSPELLPLPKPVSAETRQKPVAAESAAAGLDRLLAPALRADGGRHSAMTGTRPSRWTFRVP